ncbi:MAG: agmatinase [Firmicutes bacterium]|nr:agmatinase [Bacillota bacterium]
MKGKKANMAFVGISTFCKSPIIMDNMKDFDVAVIGVPYDGGIGFRPGARFGPRAIREMSTRYAFGETGTDASGYWDLETGKRMLEGVRIGDAGDVDILYLDYEYTFSRITEMIRRVKSEKAFPVVLGGDHSITYPVVRGLSGEGPMGIIHLDAHLDFKDEVLGVKYGNSSPIKRISELEFVDKIVSIGTRGIRTSEKDYKDAVNYGCTIIPYSEVQESGIVSVLNQIPFMDRTYVTIDIDVLDPALAPGTGSPEPEGLSYTQLINILKGIASRTDVIGFDLVEVNPQLDPTGLTPLAAARIIVEFLGWIFYRKEG